MKGNILLFLLLLKLNISFDYWLSFESLTYFNSKYDLNIENINNNFNYNKLSYTGSIEDYETILNNTNDNYESIKEENHPLVSITNSCSFENIKYFSIETIFIIDKNCTSNNSNYLNYSDYILCSLKMDNNYLDVIKNDIFFYVKIGKIPNVYIYLLILIILLFNLISNIIGFCIIRKKIKKINIMHFLPIYSSLYLYYYNFMMVLNGLNFLIFGLGHPIFDIVCEYFILFIKSLIKSHFYSSIILILQGWMIIDFDVGLKFEKYFLGLIMYELLVPLIFNISLYYITIISKLTFIFSKSVLEQILILSFIIYCTKIKLIPLYKQMNHERRIGSNLVDCLEFKFKKLFRIYLVVGIFSIIILISPFIEYQIINIYFYGHFYHNIFNSVYWHFLCAALNFIFISKRLPLNYKENIIYNYNQILFYYIIDIDEGKNKNKLNISNLNLKNLKEENYPIVFINPFTSLKDKLLFDKIYIGSTEK